MNQLFFKLRPAIIGIEIVDAKGDHSIGTGFHVGDGIVVTARHVVEGRQSGGLIAPSAQGGRVEEIIFAANPLVDVALLRTDLDFSDYLNKTHIVGMEYRKTDHLELGVEWDDFANESLVLYDVIVMGYPPIPTAFPTLVAIRAQVNAIIDSYPIDGQNSPPNYVLSGIPRGGFSGAPMIVEAGDNSFVLGVVTKALISNHNAIETGFMAAITIESVLQLLHENGLYPGDNKLAVKAFASELTKEEEAEFYKSGRNDAGVP
ncbi:MAG: serine protease [Candidatus Tectimicrobiota bacterium]